MSLAKGQSARKRATDKWMAIGEKPLAEKDRKSWSMFDEWPDIDEPVVKLGTQAINRGLDLCRYK